MNNYEILERSGWGGLQPLRISAEDRCCHMYIVGKTGSGKSTFMRNLLIQEIQNGRGVGLIDPHGSLAEDVLEHVPPWRTDDVIFFNPSDLDHPPGLNVLRTGYPPDLVASSVVGALKNIWRESWGPRLEYILYASVAALAECENVTFMGIPRLLTDEGYRYWVIRQVKDPAVRSFWTTEFENYDKRFKNEAISPILNKVGQFLMSPVIRNVLGQVRNKIDFSRILEKEQIFIANLSKAHLGAEHACLIGSLIVSQFQIAAMARAQHSAAVTNFSLCIDEFHNFLTESFCTILSESRKYGLHLTLAHQYAEQLRPEIQHAVFGNVGSMISFRVGQSDAQILAREMGPFTASQFASLERFEVIAKLDKGGAQSEPFLARSLPPIGQRFGRRANIARRSRERFSSKRSDVDSKVQRWIATQFL